MMLLEKDVNELLHTLFPGIFDVTVEPNPNSESDLVFEPSLNSDPNLNSEPDMNSSASSHSSLQGIPHQSPPHQSPSHTHTPSHVQPIPTKVLPHESPNLDQVDYSLQDPSPIATAPQATHSPGLAWEDVSPMDLTMGDVGKTPLGEKPALHRSYSLPLTSGSGDEFVGQRTRVFVAVLDYDPHSLCVTGKPEDELHFSTGG